MIRVLFNPACTSTFLEAALSMCVYDLIAPTSSEMRADPPSISRSNSSPPNVARNQPRTPPSVSSGTLSASPSSQAVSNPAPARVGEISHASSMPRSSIHIASSSSRSLTSSESSEGTIPDPRATSCGSAATKERCSRVRGRFPSSAAFSDAFWKAPRASAALRPMAAAGLFSSWARPATMVPSEISLPCYGFGHFGAFDGGREDVTENLGADPQHLPERWNVEPEKANIGYGASCRGIGGVEHHYELGEDHTFPERDDEDVLLADPAGPLGLAFHDHVESVRRVSLAGDQGPRIQPDLLRVVVDPGQLLIGQSPEERHRAQAIEDPLVWHLRPPSGTGGRTGWRWSPRRRLRRSA